MKRAFSFFKQVISKNQISHLYLISGPKGSGKLNLAYEVSYLLTRKKDDDERVLEQIKSGVHPNVILIEPTGQNIRKEQILLLQEEFSKTSLVGGKRIYIVNHVEKLSQGAANSLLKFMEEPESNLVVGILLTENKDLVLKTIISRSQTLNLSSVHKEEIRASLRESGVDEKYVALIPEVTQSLEEALELVEKEELNEIIEVIAGIASDWNNFEIRFMIKYANSLTNTLADRAQFNVFTNLLFLFFMDIVHYKVHQPITYEFIRKEIQEINSKFSIKELTDILKEIQELISKEYFNINLNLNYASLLAKLDKRR
ncbi:MAG: hypothetical protein GX794_01230 [Acholeplasmataceae bacterium]|jgi:DNA polymerase-3 subunit delta'|nr:hypothetical protein [Acholeplasmataceae bacterium]